MKGKMIRMRTTLLACIAAGVLVLYLLRLMQIQVVEGEALSATIERGANSVQIIKAARGEILDRNGRPLAINTVGRDVVIDQAYLESGSINTVIQRLIEIMEANNETWIDNLPLTDRAPFQFKEGYEAQVNQLIKTLEVQQYATADDCVYLLRQKYKLEELSDEEFRKVAGVRYEMTRRGFSMSAPYTFATNIRMETVPRIKERSFELQGVEVVESPIRQYVSGDIAPHLIGSIGPIYAEQWKAAEGYIEDTKTGTLRATIGGQTYAMTDMIGKSGIELAFEKYLKGVDGERKIVQDARGKVVDVADEKAQSPGNTVVTTIDSKLQKVAQDALERKIIAMQNDLINYPPGRGHEADAGAVVVLDVKTGELLVSATYPSFNLSTYAEDYAQLASPPKGTPSRLVNRALDGTYMPGSIFKPVIALGGIAEGIVTGHDQVNCTRIYNYFTGSWKPTCLSYHGAVDVVNALRVSCNIYFYDVGRRLGIERIDKYAASLGLGLPTGLELPHAVGQVSSPELKAKLRNGEKWQEGDTVQTAIGQYDTMLSPLQIANFCATLANNGKRMKITALKSVRSYNFDEVIYEHEPEIAEQIDAPQAFEDIRQGMIAASSVSGTAGAVFGNYPILVASKTGTPEASTVPNSTFIAYAPANDPQIAVCVVIEKGWHGYTGAPVAKEIFDAYFSIGSGNTGPSNAYGQLLP